MYAEGDKNHYFPNYYDPCITAEHFIKYHSMNFSSRNPDLYALVWSQNLHRRNNSPSDCHRSLWISLDKIKILKQLPILSNSLEILMWQSWEILMLTPHQDQKTQPPSWLWCSCPTEYQGKHRAWKLRVLNLISGSVIHLYLSSYAQSLSSFTIRDQEELTHLRWQTFRMVCTRISWCFRGTPQRRNTTQWYVLH